MIRVASLVFVFCLFKHSTAYTQCSENSFNEIACVSDSVLKLHQNDDFYFYVRFLPSVRESIEEFVLTKSNDRWAAKYYRTTFKPPPWEGTNHTKRKQKLKISEINDSSLAFFLKSVDLNKLVNYTNSDSISLDESKLPQGIFNHFIIICSKGVVNLIEYPVVRNYIQNNKLKKQSIYWQSNYLNDLLKKIKQLLMP